MNRTKGLEIVKVGLTSEKVVGALRIDLVSSDDYIRSIKHQADDIYRNEFKGQDKGSSVFGMSLKMLVTSPYKPKPYYINIVGQICQGSITNEEYFDRCIEVFSEGDETIKTLFSIEYGRMI